MNTYTDIPEIPKVIPGLFYLEKAKVANSGPFNDEKPNLSFLTKKIFADAFNWFSF